ncbi:DUF6089 family protein [Flavobacterium agricola]|uniref:DUF6089 family protein n=1 Tax=Flavobacterium agricola TaxID=2870839 RepID=A0ABY6LWN5_9FLAO|nr:DUF6089 family protein [Flavobacterium agricola]UYW00742.1 DUF6089 family protein [Flavobacterium agricola]
MKKLFVLFILLTFSNLHAQINEIGVFAGGTSFIGDVGKMNYVGLDEPAVGLLYRWNRSTRHAWRASLTHAKIADFDSKSNMPSRLKRGYSFHNTVTELAAGLEFNFFDYDLHSLNNQFTPYVFVGLAGFSYHELAIYYGQNYRLEKNKFSMAIPMAVGVKSKFTRNFTVGAEIGFRYTFTDNLDGSHPSNEKYQSLRFGNLNSNDWYVFTGITLTYTFGQNPCFCPF